MNRFSQFFRKLLPTIKKEKTAETFTIEAPLPSKRTRVTTHIRKNKGYAFSQYGNGRFKPLPIFIQLGVNREQSIEYHKRHVFEVAK